MRSAIVAIYNIFFACLVFWGISCGQSNTPSPETDPNDSVTDLHVDQLNTGNVEQIALSVLTNGYYNQYWSGLTYTPKIPGSTIGGTIIEYLNVSTANYTANQGTWVVQDLGLNTSTLLEVIDTDTAYPKVAVKSNVTTLSSADFTFVKQKSSAGVTYYCTNACAACYNSTTGVSNNPNVTCSNSTQKIGFWVKYTDTTNTTHAYLNWIPLDTSYAQPYMDNLSGSLTYISSNYNSNNGFGIVNLDVNSDASFGPSGMNFNNTATRSVSVLIRIEDCTNEDAITLNSGTWTINGTSVNIGNTQYATYTTWSSLVSEDYASFTVDTAGSNNKYCDTKFFFKGNASGVVGNLLQNLQYKNTATSGNAIEGRRTIHVFLRREDSNNSYAYVSKPETIEVDVWNPPVLTETTPVTTPTLDSTPSITLTSTKAGTISFTGGCSSDTTTLIVGSNTIDLAADTNGSGLSDGTYSCTVQLTETETGASLTSNVLTLTTFVVDTTAPQISITTDIGNANGYVNSLTPSIVLESDEAGDVVLANCSNTASMTNQTVTVRANNTVTFDTLGNGTTYAGCEITVVDSVGNTSSAVIAATFTVDATAPTISLSPSTAFSTQDTTPDVVLTSDEAGSISFTNCSSTTTSIFATANTITLRASGGGAFSEGTYSTCSMTVTDIANNTSSITVPSMSIDLTGPTISIATQVTSPTNDSTPSFSLTSNEIGTATISGDCSGSSAVTASTQTISIDTLTDGVYSNCTVFVTDRAGNTSTIRSLTSFTVDLTPPSVPVVTAITTDTTVFSLAGVDAITNIANVEFQGTTDAGTSLVVSITNTSNTTLTCSVSSANTSAGSWLCNKTTSAGDTYSANLAGGIYTISAVATDSAGNTRSTNSVFTLKVDTTVPTISETTAVAANASPANRSSDPTPDVVLTPSEAGVLTLGGNCYNSANSVLGSVANTITLYYTTGGGFPDNNTTGYTCTVRVTDAAGNISTPALSLTTFKVLVGAPTLTEVVATNSATGLSLTDDITPNVVIDSTTAINTAVTGSITFGGKCSSTTQTTLAIGNNTITLDLSANLSADGVYSNCTLIVNDGTTNSNSITLSSFTIDTQAPTFTSGVNDFSIPERSSAGTTVGTVQVSDATPVTFSEGAGETGDSIFQISSAGVITLSSGQNLDYETTASYDYNVIVTDATGASTNQTFTIAVSDANDAPSLDSNHVSNFATITEDATSNAGTIVSALLVDGGNNPAISDVDANAVQGIAVYSANDSNGTWQYSTNAGVSWTNFPTVSATSALLLSDSAYVRFVPDAARADSASFSFYAWDQASGSEASNVSVSSRGGGTAFSTANATVSITVTDINDAPVLSNATPVTLLPVITEDNITSSGYLVSTIIGATITDPDANASTGIALNSASSTNGEWEYSTDNGGTWNGVGALTTNDVLPLLPTHLIRFVPDQENGSNASVSFYAWDVTTGTGGLGVTISSTGGTTAYSTTIGTANLTVSAVNDAPVLNNNVTANFATISESIGSASNTGELVSTLLGSGMSDVDSVSQDGIAIYSADARNGTWQYSTDNAVTWSALGTPSVTQARLLRSDSNARVRFVPNSNFSTATVANPATISFYAWDGSVGSNGGTRNVTTTGGTTAFSTASATSSIVVTDTNDAPVLTASSVVNLTSITEDDSTVQANDGDLLSTVIGSSISDPDSATATEGVAVYSVTSTNGKWQYAVDGSTWTDFGSVSETAAILLESDATTRIRFLPNNQNGVTATLSFYAWDVTDGSSAESSVDVSSANRGLETSFSTNAGTTTIVVTDANDAPVLGANVSDLTSITENDTATADNPGSLINDMLNGQLTDVDTGAVKGIAVYNLSSGNSGHWEYSTDSGSSWTSFPSVSMSSSLLLAGSSYIRFMPDGANGETATISFYGWDKRTGSETGLVNLGALTLGGTTAYSTTNATASIVVTDLNDAPVLNNASPYTLNSITEDNSSGTITDYLISTIIGSTITDSDTGSVKGLAISSVSTTNGYWEYSTDSGVNWNGFGSGVSTSAAVLLSSNAMIRFVTNLENGTTATMSVYAWDQTTGSEGSTADVTTANRGGTTAFSSNANTISLVVSSVNDAPILGSSVSNFTGITENDTSNSGQSISAILNGQLTDVDTGSGYGIAIYAKSAGNSGHWEYSTNSGSTWTTLPTVSLTSAFLLDYLSYIRFVPDGSNGETATLSFRGWDKSTGTATGTVNLNNFSPFGTTTPYSDTNATVSIVVSSVNDAPVLNNASPYTLTPITEDNSSGTITDYLISTIIGSTITDSDTGSVKGLAISSVSTTNGYWEYSTDSGVNWNGFGSGVSTSAAVLLSSNAMIRFVTNLENGTTATMSVYAWDQTTGSEGSTADVTTANRGGTTAFSSNANTISLVVSSVNDAPVLTAANLTNFTTITEDDTSNTGSLISSLLTLSGTSAVEDVDSGTSYGLAIYATSATNGTWQYTVNGGTNWNSMGTPSTTQARLLTANANTRVRFVPNAIHSGSGTLSIYAWDTTSGSNGGTGSVSTVGGTSAFSSSSSTLTITVNALNDAPVLGTTSNVANITEDDTSPTGTLISSIIASSDVDPTSTASGIAVYGVTETNGAWEYSLDGSTWIAFGSVSTSAARLLDSGDYIRFVPDAENGDTPTLSLYAWDQTAGSVGGTASVASVGTTTPYSSASATVGLTVSSVNDAPVLTAEVGNFSTITEDQTTNSGNTANSLLNGRDSDVDTSALRGIAIYQTTVATGGGTWQYSVDLGVNWINIGTVSTTSALVLRSWDSVRFRPDGQNRATGSVSFVAWDGASTLRGTKVDSSTRGTTSNFSSVTGTSSITVTDVNDAPTITAGASTYAEGASFTSITTINVADVDTSEQVTVTLSLNSVNWPDDANAPDGTGSRYFSDENGGLVILDVIDTYGGYLQTTNYSWLNSQLQFTGTVADVNAELQTLKFIPTANYNSGANYNSDTIPDYDLDSIISVQVADAGGPLATASLSANSSMNFTCASRDNDKPVAIGYWDAYNTRNGARNETASDLITSLDATNYQGKFIRVDAGMSWDPDYNDSVVSYTFTPNLPVIITCNGATTALDAATGCTPNNGVDYIIQDAQLTTVIWTITVNDGTTNNTVLDLYDQVVVSVANTAPHVAIFAGDSNFTCSRAHAKAYDNPVFVDENLDCFCDESSCNNSSVCADSQGRSCTPSRSQINTCTSIPAVYVDATAQCFCEEMDCDGVDSNGDDNCFDSNNDPCTPVLNANGVQQDYCAPIVSPINFSYPFDLDVDLKACTFDENDDPLIFTWSINFNNRTNIIPQSGFHFTSSSRNATVSVEPTDYAAQYGDVNVSLSVYDGEDRTEHEIDINFCAGWFEDMDGDFYGSNSEYVANCSNLINPYYVTVPQNGATSVVQGADYVGLDCWDDPNVNIVDTNTVVGALASAASYSAAAIQDEIHWFIDYDNDGYGATAFTYDNQTYFPNRSLTLAATTGDDADQNGYLDATQGTTAVLPLVWPESCTLTPPSTVDRTGRTVHYVLNQDDCNDSRSFADGDYANYLSPSTNGNNGVPAGVRRGSNRQNPETIWYADVDGDGFAATLSTFAVTDGYVYFDSNLDCMCKSDCGSLSACYSVVNNASRAANAVSATCVPTGSCTAYAAEYRQCEHPVASPYTQNLTNIPDAWFLDNSAGKGDCNETTSNINEGESEVCDPGDVDENCNNLADDNDSNVLGAFSYFADADSDGYPTRVGKSVSCDGGSVTGYSLINYYTLSNPDGLTAGQNCICPTNTCDVGCRLASNRTVSCAPAVGDAPVCTNVNNIAIGTAYDFTATEFTDFALYVEDCNDVSVGIYPRATEVCDGVRNDCMLRSQGTPVTEVDYDNDRYVECYFDGSTWRGSAAPLVGSDCSPNDANVYPNAASICDGQYNNCASWRDEYEDETGTCFCAGVRTDGSCNPGYCTDAAGFSCTPTDLDADGFLTCTATGDKKSPGAPADQTDNDGDCYVECFNGATSWVGDIALLGANCSTILEGEDCNDTSNLVYPDAIEVCDGQFNNCNSPAFVATGAPVNETDNDGDGYVECDAGEYIDMQGCRCTVGVDSNADGVVDSYSSCRNSRNQTCVPDLPTMSAVTWVAGNTGYSDCDDLNDTRYPTASDICDGIFNDCTHPLLSPFVAATGEDCYCPANSTANCMDTAGNTCVPTKELVALTNPRTIAASNYGYQETECYCPTASAQIDIDTDGLSDCLDQNKRPCQPTDVDGDGFGDTVIADPLNATTLLPVSKSMYILGQAPGRELDNDGDRYVECNYAAALWVGSAYVVGGNDCNDFPTNSGNRIYPGATERCDGVYNNCSDPTYSAITAPTTESDVDNDGYVACSLTPGFGWIGGLAPSGYGDCIDTNFLVYPGAIELCDGVYNNCSISNYSLTGAPTSEVDNDGDGYVDCSNEEYIDANACLCTSAVDVNVDGVFDSNDTYADCENINGQLCVPDLNTIAMVAWAGPEVDGYEDCNDLVAVVYPAAEEICDGRFNNCSDPLNPLNPDTAGMYTGVVGNCFCPNTTCLIDVDLDGNSDCVDSAGLACDPTDDNNDGYADNCALSSDSMVIANSNYFTVQAECYCPTPECGYDFQADGLSRCYAPNGDACQAPLDANNFYVDCASNPATTAGNFTYVFRKPNGAQVTQPFDEIDNDGDRYVDCPAFDRAAWTAAGSSVQVLDGNDCDDKDARVYPNATEYCDGQFNNCNDVAFSLTGPPATETDDDGDGYVECSLTNGVPWAIADTNPLGAGIHYKDSFGCYCDGPCGGAGTTCADYSGSACLPVVATCVTVGGFSDCDDTDAWVFPTGPALCDGQYNDCSGANFSLTVVPPVESDVDGDGYVQCADDGSVWRGPVQPVGYGDCSDTDASTNGGAPEVCDGIFNDCNHPQKFPFEGVVGDCYCPTTDCLIDNGQGSQCVDITGATCTPVDENNDNHADYCNASLSVIAIAGRQYRGVEVECYCPTESCQLDTTSDGVVDCLTPTGQVCATLDDGNGFAASCAQGTPTPHVFTKANGTVLTGPMDETDHDGDGFVECEYQAASWEGSLSVHGGLDCDDTDALVHPGATEYCDGQYNNCSDLTYNANSAPANESDVDQDGYVACGFTNGVPWARANVPTDDGDCEDTDATVYPTAIEVCDGQYNNCSTFGYSLNGAPANETDNDGDGYVDCPSGQYLDTNGCMCASVTDSNGDGIPDVFNSCSNATGAVCTPDAGSISAVVWAGRTQISGYADCQDANVRMYPGAPESCDGIFNNCNHPQKSAYHGVVSDCFCPTLDTNGDGTRDTCVASNCVDSAGATCSPVDEDNNGYVDPEFCYISTTPEVVNAQNYYGAEVDCYCPNDSCQIDVLSNGLSDCLTPRGETCIPTDSINVGFADNCVDGFTVSHTFTLGNGSALTRPFDEMDNDGDGYVECTYQPAIWLGSFSVVGGLDCDDYDDAVYPTAQEVCDGQYNDCLNNYVVNGAPANEVDNDGDGWVECARDSDVVWNAYNGMDMVNIRGYGTDGTINGTIECICSDSACSQDCTTPQGATCTVLPQYCAPHESYENVDCDDTDFYAHPYLAYNESANIARALSIASCLRDRDGDGYGDSSPVNTAVTAGRDCDDLNQLVHPEQNEVCEVGTQVDSDCNGDVNTADYAAGYLLDTNGNGSLLYVDDDGDGFGDSRTAATPACEVAAGFVFNATDCNDDNANINPTAKEICDGVDQDCDLTIDEAESLDTPSISKCTYMYRDVDGDSYGDADYAACLCQEGSNASVTYNDYEYVIYSGDCYDFNADIRPLSCSDGIDQDDDGFVDARDSDCIAGYEEGSTTTKEQAFELIDGHDNNCDGLVAAIELDCDDDGSFPSIPAESIGFNRSNKFQLAAEIGLEACSGLSTNLSCWNEQQRLVCDQLTAEIVDGNIEYNGTGLWMLPINESDDGFGNRFKGGHREYPNGVVCGSALGDCDDQCADRCPGKREECDGLDNNCSNATSGTDGGVADAYKGFPDSLIASVPVAGTISDVEIDIDSDGFLACDNFTSTGQETQWSDASCGSSGGMSEDNDCNNFCFFSSPNAEERCDAFQGVCGGEKLDGVDTDYDDMLTCGTWGADDTLTEDVYVVVWLKNVNWSELASEEQELIRPVTSADQIAEALSDSGLDREDTALDDGLLDSGDTGYSMQETERERLFRKRANFVSNRVPIMNTNGLLGGDVDVELLENMIPLVAPRNLAPYCDSYLSDQLTLLLGQNNMQALRTASIEEEADILLQACELDDAAGCAIVRLSLSKTTDDDTYDYLDSIQSQILSFSDECEARPEEWVSRTMWQRDRIVEARRLTVEWECRRMYGKACNEISSQTRLSSDWMESMVSAERWLDTDRVWFKELGRYNPAPIDDGTMMSCWGDPSDETTKLNERVGGDCNDDNNEAHRDIPEGPGDLVGIYLYGETADCSTCLDGIDNNCDGAIDCADPACAPCFVGQGVGCGGGADSPCSQGGCSSPDQGGQDRLYKSIALIMMALVVSRIRRRENA